MASIAKSSVSEVKSQLYRAKDRNFITKEKFEEAFNLADDITRLIGGFVNYLRDKNTRKIK